MSTTPDPIFQDPSGVETDSTKTEVGGGDGRECGESHPCPAQEGHPVSSRTTDPRGPTFGQKQISYL